MCVCVGSGIGGCVRRVACACVPFTHFYSIGGVGVATTPHHHCHTTVVVRVRGPNLCGGRLSPSTTRPVHHPLFLSLPVTCHTATSTLAGPHSSATPSSLVPILLPFRICAVIWFEAVVVVVVVASTTIHNHRLHQHPPNLASFVPFGQTHTVIIVFYRGAPHGHRDPRFILRAPLLPFFCTTCKVDLVVSILVHETVVTPPPSQSLSKRSSPECIRLNTAVFCVRASVCVCVCRFPTRQQHCQWWSDAESHRRHLVATSARVTTQTYHFSVGRAPQSNGISKSLCPHFFFKIFFWVLSRMSVRLAYHLNQTATLWPPLCFGVSHIWNLINVIDWCAHATSNTYLSSPSKSP